METLLMLYYTFDLEGIALMLGFEALGIVVVVDVVVDDAAEAASVVFQTNSPYWQQ